MDEWVLADELTAFVAYCCTDKKHGEATVTGKLMGWGVPAAEAIEGRGRTENI